MDAQVMKILEHHLNQALVQYGQGEFYEVLRQTKEEYCQLIGYGGDEEEDNFDFESKMGLFNDWYVLDFNLPGKDRTIIYDYIVKNLIDERYHDLLLNVNYSIFEYCGVDLKKRIVLFDIVHDKKYRLYDGHPPMALLQKDLFIGRVLGTRASAYLRPGMCILPKEVRPILRKQARIMREYNDAMSEKAFLLKVESLRTRWKRYGHISADKIFVFDQSIHS